MGNQKSKLKKSETKKGIILNEKKDGIKYYDNNNSEEGLIYNTVLNYNAENLRKNFHLNEMVMRNFQKCFEKGFENYSNPKNQNFLKINNYLSTSIIDN